MHDMHVHPLYIHGQYTPASSGLTFESINPANGEVIATIQQASQQDIEKAVQKATAYGLDVKIFKKAIETLQDRLLDEA